MSRLPFELFLALRYLRPRRTFVSLITLISVVGVMLGVAVLLIVIAVMTGFDREWRERILSFNAHLKVVRPGEAMRDWTTPLSLITAQPGVRGAAPYIEEEAVVEGQPAGATDATTTTISGAILRGIDPVAERRVSNLADKMCAGTYNLDGKGALLGLELARKLNVRPGDRLAVYSKTSLQRMHRADRAKEELAVLPDEFQVRGLFDVGFNEFNASMVIVSLESAQELYDLDDRVHGLTVMLDNPFQADAARRRLESVLGPAFRAATWAQMNQVLFGALATEKTMMYVILFIVMIVAAFAIANSEITFTVNKIKEIGLLKALGAANRQVMWIFLGHSMAIGVFGVGLGFGLGEVFLHSLNDVLRLVRRTTGFDLLPAAIYQIHELPWQLLAHDVTIICGGGFLICVLAGLLPASKAARLDAVEALRHE
jgi:lipoprotein-releasing system permease protein